MSLLNAVLPMLTALPAIMQYSFSPCPSPIKAFRFEDVPHSCRKCCIGAHLGIEPQLPTTEYTVGSLSNHASVQEIYSTSGTTNIALTFRDNSEKIRYLSSKLKWGLSEDKIKRLIHGDRIQINAKILDNITKKAGNKLRYVTSNGRSQNSIKEGLFWFVPHPGNRLSSNKSSTLQVAQNSKSIKGSEDIVKTPYYQTVDLLAQSSSNSIVVFCYTFEGHTCQVTLDINTGGAIRYV